MKQENIVNFAVEIINDSIRKNEKKEDVEKKLNDFKYYLKSQGYSNHIFEKLFKEMGQIVSIVFDVNEHSPLSTGELIQIIDDAIEKYIVKSDLDRMFDAIDEEKTNSEIDNQLEIAFKIIEKSKDVRVTPSYGEIRETTGCGDDVRVTPSCGEIRETTGCGDDVRVTPSCGEIRETTGCGDDVRVTPSCGGRTRGHC